MDERSTARHAYRSVTAATAGGARDIELEAFVADNYGRLIRLAALIAGDPREAEDAVQAALERAWRNRSSLNDPTRIRSWLDRIVVREAIRAQRRRHGLLVWMRHADAADMDRIHDPHADPDERAGLRAAFAKLSRPQRAVVVLHLYAGYSVAETAALLNVPLDTARSRLRSARAQLRRDLEEAE